MITSDRLNVLARIPTRWELSRIKKCWRFCFGVPYEEGLTKKQARIEDVFHKTTLET